MYEGPQTVEKKDDPLAGRHVVENAVHQVSWAEDLYTAAELFFTGTASEVTAVRSVDKIPIGEGKAGPVKLAIEICLVEVVTGQEPDAQGWLALLGGRFSPWS